MRIDWASRSDKGRVRHNNEDAVSCQPEDGLAILCDGMGGHLAGEVASRLAVETFLRHFKPASPGEPSPLEEDGIPIAAVPLILAARESNVAVSQESRSNPSCRGMGCTLVTLRLDGGTAAFANIGDSRLYLLRGGALRQVSEDHTRIRMLERMGVELGNLERQSLKGVITRAVGTHPSIEVDYGVAGAPAGDVWILCSDGLTDEVPDEAIREILVRAEDARSATDRLVRAAIEAGGHDNVSIVVARVLESPTPAEGASLPYLRTYPPEA